MPVVTAIALYFVIWWISLFAVLPIGTSPVADADSQTGWRGAKRGRRRGSVRSWASPREREG